MSVQWGSMDTGTGQRLEHTPELESDQAVRRRLWRGIGWGLALEGYVWFMVWAAAGGWRTVHAWLGIR